MMLPRRKGKNAGIFRGDRGPEKRGAAVPDAPRLQAGLFEALPEEGCAAELTLLLPDLGQQHCRIGEASALFPAYELVEIAGLAVLELLREGPLHLALAEGTAYDPAGTAGIRPVMDIVQAELLRGRADAQVVDMAPLGLASALLELPAVQLPRARCVARPGRWCHRCAFHSPPLAAVILP